MKNANKQKISLLAYNKQVPTTGTIDFKDVLNYIETKDFEILKSNIEYNKYVNDPNQTLFSEYQINEVKHKNILIPLYGEVVNKIRNLKNGSKLDKAIYTVEKSKLPTILPHSYSDIDTKGENVKGISNILFYDMDEILTEKQTKYFLTYLQSLDYVQAITLSASGKFHIFIKSEYTVETFYNVYYELLQKLTIECGLNNKLFDTAVGQLTRKAFLSTEIVYRNDNCNEYVYNNTSKKLADLIKKEYHLKTGNPDIRLFTESDVKVEKEYIDETVNNIEVNKFIDIILKRFTVNGSEDYNGASKDFFNRLFRYDIDEIDLEDAYFRYIPYTTKTENTFKSMFKRYSSYSNYRSQSLTLSKQVVQNEPIVVVKTEEQSYFKMKQSEKLNKHYDVIKSKMNKLILLADTKLGKTTTMIDLYTKDGITIIALPGKVQVDDIYNKQKHNFNENEMLKVIGGVNVKKIKESTDVKLFICTYDSMYKILEVYSACDVNLIIDELHKFIEDYGFRNAAIDSVINFIKYHNFKNICLMTGTFIPEMKMIDFSMYNTLEFRYETPVRHRFVIVDNPDDKNNLRTLINRIKKDVKDGKRVLFHNNNFENNQKYVNVFEDNNIKVARIDRHHKDTNIGKDIQVILATASFDVGLGIDVPFDSVYINTSWTNTATFLSIENIIQIINRDDRDNKLNKSKDIFIFNTFRNSYTDCNSYIDNNIKKLIELSKLDKAVRNTRLYTPLVSTIINGYNTDITFDFIDNNDGIESNKNIENYIRFYYRKIYQYINLDYFKQYAALYNCDVITIDEFENEDNIKIKIGRKDYTKLDESIEKVVNNKLRKYSTYDIDTIKILTDEDVIISKLLDDPEFTGVKLLSKLGYKEYIRQFTQYKNITSITDENKDVFEKFRALIKTDRYFQLSTLQNIFNKSLTFRGLKYYEVLPKLKEWCDVKKRLISNDKQIIQYTMFTMLENEKYEKSLLYEYTLIFPLNENTIEILKNVKMFEDGFYSKEELMIQVAEKGKVVFNFESIEKFWASLKKYCTLNGLQIESKRVRVGGGVQIIKYSIK